MLPADVSEDLRPCEICGRTFLPRPLTKHLPVCEKNASKKRKIFDSLKQRIEGTDLAPFHQKSYLKKHNPPVQLPEPPRQSNWKQKHMELVSAIRAAKGVQEPMPGPKRSGTSFGSQVNERCPSCDRHFGPKAYDRHVEWCKERRTTIHKSPASVQMAKERLEARTKYKVPPLNKSRRTITREKYSPQGSRVDCLPVNLKSSSACTLDRSPSIRKSKTTLGNKKSFDAMHDNSSQEEQYHDRREKYDRADAHLKKVASERITTKEIGSKRQQQEAMKSPKKRPIPSSKLNTTNVNKSIQGLTVNSINTASDNEGTSKRMMTWKDTVKKPKSTRSHGSTSNLMSCKEDIETCGDSSKLRTFAKITESLSDSSCHDGCKLKVIIKEKPMNNSRSRLPRPTHLSSPSTSNIDMVEDSSSVTSISRIPTKTLNVKKIFVTKTSRTKIVDDCPPSPNISSPRIVASTVASPNYISPESTSPKYTTKVLYLEDISPRSLPLNDFRVKSPKIGNLPSQTCGVSNEVPGDAYPNLDKNLVMNLKENNIENNNFRNSPPCDDGIEEIVLESTINYNNIIEDEEEKAKSATTYNWAFSDSNANVKLDDEDCVLAEVFENDDDSIENGISFSTKDGNLENLEFASLDKDDRTIDAGYYDKQMESLKESLRTSSKSFVVEESPITFLGDDFDHPNTFREEDLIVSKAAELTKDASSGEEHDLAVPKRSELVNAADIGLAPLIKSKDKKTIYCEKFLERNRLLSSNIRLARKSYSEDNINEDRHKERYGDNKKQEKFTNETITKSKEDRRRKTQSQTYMEYEEIQREIEDFEAHLSEYTPSEESLSEKKDEIVEAAKAAKVYVKMKKDAFLNKEAIQTGKKERSLNNLQEILSKVQNDEDVSRRTKNDQFEEEPGICQRKRDEKSQHEKIKIPPKEDLQILKIEQKDNQTDKFIDGETITMLKEFQIRHNFEKEYKFLRSKFEEINALETTGNAKDLAKVEIKQVCNNSGGDNKQQESASSDCEVIEFKSDDDQPISSNNNLATLPKAYLGSVENSEEDEESHEIIERSKFEYINQKCIPNDNTQAIQEDNVLHENVKIISEEQEIKECSEKLIFKIRESIGEVEKEGTDTSISKFGDIDRIQTEVREIKENFKKKIDIISKTNASMQTEDFRVNESVEELSVVTVEQKGNENDFEKNKYFERVEQIRQSRKKKISQGVEDAEESGSLEDPHESMTLTRRKSGQNLFRKGGRIEAVAKNEGAEHFVGNGEETQKMFVKKNKEKSDGNKKSILKRSPKGRNETKSEGSSMPPRKLIAKRKSTESVTLLKRGGSDKINEDDVEVLRKESAHKQNSREHFKCSENRKNTGIEDNLKSGDVTKTKSILKNEEIPANPLEKTQDKDTECFNFVTFKKGSLHKLEDVEKAIIEERTKSEDTIQPRSRSGTIYWRNLATDGFSECDSVVDGYENDHSHALSVARIERQIRNCCSDLCLPNKSDSSFVSFTEIDLRQHYSYQSTNIENHDMTYDEILEIAGNQFVADFKKDDFIVGDRGNKSMPRSPVLQKSPSDTVFDIPHKRRKLEDTQITDKNIGAYKMELRRNIIQIKEKTKKEAVDSESSTEDFKNLVLTTDHSFIPEESASEETLKHVLSTIKETSSTGSSKYQVDAGTQVNFEAIESSFEDEETLSNGIPKLQNQRNFFKRPVSSSLFPEISPRFLHVIRKVMSSDPPVNKDPNEDTIMISKRHCRKMLYMDRKDLDSVLDNHPLKLPGISQGYSMPKARKYKDEILPQIKINCPRKVISRPEEAPWYRPIHSADYPSTPRDLKFVKLVEAPFDVQIKSKSDTTYDPFLSAEKQFMELLECDDFKPFTAKKQPITTQRPHTTDTKKQKSKSPWPATRKLISSGNKSERSKIIHNNNVNNTKRASVIDPPADFRDRLSILNDDFELIENLINDTFSKNINKNNEVNKNNIYTKADNNSFNLNAILNQRKYSDDLSSIDPRLINENDDLSIPDHFHDDTSPTSTSTLNYYDNGGFTDHFSEKFESKIESGNTTEIKLKQSISMLDDVTSSFLEDKQIDEFLITLKSPDDPKLIDDNHKPKKLTRISKLPKTISVDKSNVSINSSAGLSHKKDEKKKNLASLKRSISLLDPVQKTKPMKNKQDVQNYFNEQQQKSPSKSTPPIEIVKDDLPLTTAGELFSVDDAMYEEYKRYEEMYLREKEEKMRKEEHRISDGNSGLLTGSEDDDGHSKAPKVSGDSAYGSLNRRTPKPRARSTKLSPLDSQKSLVGDSCSSSSSESSPVPTIGNPKMSKFCHECGNRYPLAVAKFCVECGVKRLVL